MNPEETLLANQINADAQNQDDRKHRQEDKVQHERATGRQKSASIQLSKYHDKVIFVYERGILICRYFRCNPGSRKGGTALPVQFAGLRSR